MENVLNALCDRGLLLVQDKRVASVVGLVTGDSLSGSWWSHPKAKQIFGILESLSDHPDVLLAKLVSGKATLVHRRLWPEVMTIATAREAWQVEGMSDAAIRLLAELDERRDPIRATGPAVRELAVRLLATTRQEHTDSGKHVLAMEPWTTWAERVGCVASNSVEDARRSVELAAMAVGAAIDSLPWNRGNRARGR